jgi:hypothetical protein
VYRTIPLVTLVARQSHQAIHYPCVIVLCRKRNGMEKKSGGATGWMDNGLGILRPSVGDNLLELGIGEENVIHVAALDRLVRSKAYGQVAQQGVGRVAEVGHQGAHLLLGRAELGETELVDLGDDGGDLGAGEKIAGPTQDTCLIAFSVDLDELGETGLSTPENVVKADEEDGFFGNLLTALLVERVSTRIPEGVPTIVVDVREKVNDRSAMADGPSEGEDVMDIVQGDVGEQVCVVRPFWLEDVDAAGGANQAGRKHGKKLGWQTELENHFPQIFEVVHCPFGDKNRLVYMPYLQHDERGQPRHTALQLSLPP